MTMKELCLHTTLPWFYSQVVYRLYVISYLKAIYVFGILLDIVISKCLSPFAE